MSQATKSNKTKRNKILVVILSIAVVLLFVLTGWYLFMRPQSAQQNSATDVTRDEQIYGDAAKPDKTPQDDIAQARNIFKIPELGIQFVLPEGLEGLTYTAKTESNGNIDIFFTTESLQAIDGPASRCATSDDPIGGILKSKDNQKVGQGGDALVEKTIDGYHIGYYSPQQPCSNNKTAADLQSHQVDLLLQAFNSLTAITQ